MCQSWRKNTLARHWPVEAHQVPVNFFFFFLFEPTPRRVRYLELRRHDTYHTASSSLIVGEFCCRPGRHGPTEVSRALEKHPNTCVQASITLHKLVANISTADTNRVKAATTELRKSYYPHPE